MKSELIQSYLFKNALKEIGSDISFRCDHKNGYNYINDTRYEIIYPGSYIKQIDNISKEKKYEYCFVGHIGKLGRQTLLEKFNKNGSIIKNSDNGRNVSTKYNFDLEYFQILSNSRFSLCPNHIGDWYNHDRAWTYRYIESLFCKTIPILFKETPLGKDFLKDTFFLWDTDDHNLSDSDYFEIVEENYRKSLTYWSFSNVKVTNV